LPAILGHPQPLNVPGTVVLRFMGSSYEFADLALAQFDLVHVRTRAPKRGDSRL